MEYKEIKAKLKEIGLTSQKLGTFGRNGDCVMYDDETGDEIEYDVIGMLNEHFGTVYVADTSYFHDGYECWVVFHFKKDDIYLKVSGYFSSYDGTEWDRMAEVFPEEKTVIVFNEKKKENK